MICPLLQNSRRVIIHGQLLTEKELKNKISDLKHDIAIYILLGILFLAIFGMCVFMCTRPEFRKDGFIMCPITFSLLCSIVLGMANGSHKARKEYNNALKLFQQRDGVKKVNFNLSPVRIIAI